MPKGGTDTTRSLDAQVGANLRAVRLAAGRRLSDVALLLGVTPTQISEYELGNDRIGAGALYLLAKTFDVRVGRFYAGLAIRSGVAEEPTSFGGPPAAQATLLAALAVAPLKAQRRAIRAALKALSTPPG